MYFFYYYPIGVDVPRPRIPWVTLSLMVGMAAVFAASAPLAHLNTVDWVRYVYRPAQVDMLTPLTAVFLHGGWAHLLGNLLYLWVFGPALERVLGRFGLLLVFVGTGYLGNLAHGAIVLHTDPSQVWSGVVGASGAISGMLGLFLVRFPYGHIRLAWWVFMPLQGMNRAGVAELPAAAGVLLWVLLQLVMMLIFGPANGTAYGAHLGGLATGLVLSLALGMPWRARTEGLVVKARRTLRKGNAHAAIGLFERYLERVGWDDEARLDLARARRVAGDIPLAGRAYREVLKGLLAERRMVEASEVYAEARRGDPTFHLQPDAQRKLAFWLEKQCRWEDAVRAWSDLARFHQDHPDAVHALARSASLMVTRLRREHEGLEQMERILRDYPDHPLRDVLQQEHRKLVRTAWNRVAA